MRKAAYVIPHEDSESEEESDREDDPLSKIARKYVRERENSDDEEDIPLMELAKRLKAREERIALEQEEVVSDDDKDDVPLAELAKRSNEEPMDCAEVKINPDSRIDCVMTDASVSDSDEEMTGNQMEEIEKPVDVQRRQNRRRKLQMKRKLRLKLSRSFSQFLRVLLG